MTKKALVTGALGHTGSFLVNLLIDEGWTVVATDLEPKTRKDLMKKETVFSDKYKYMSIEHEGVTFIAANLIEKESLKALFKEEKDYDVIFHPASLYDYFAELELLRKINVGGLQNFLEVIHETYGDDMPRFIHWSTCGVYGEPEYEKNSKGFVLPSDETAPYAPPNNYSISKMEQEIVLKEFSDQHPLKWTIIRPAPIYGPYQTYGAFHIFKMVQKMGHMVLPIIFPKNKKLMMPMIHVEDLVSAALFLYDKDEAIGEAYNLVGDTTTEEEWMEFSFQELGLQYTHIPVWYKIYKIAAKIAFIWAESQEKRAKRFGVRPKFDLPMAGYIIHNYFFTNKKIKDLGFKFEYGNPFKGTRQTLRWYIDRGWLESEEFILDSGNYVPDSELELTKEVRK
ncbi:MAG: NAD(P)-dependent oxidoreductase [archaeon]|nr:NAD(P)-dependent oxidoreductase [archaeon]